MANPINLLSECPAAPAPVHRDTLMSADTAIVITTACAPICSSVARVYAINKVSEDAVWTFIRTIPAPDEHAVFQEAYFDNGHLLWRDNTPDMLDDEEKNSKL